VEFPVSVLEARLVKIKRQNDRISDLLDDPHPGLGTWLLALFMAIREMGDIANGERDE